MVKHVSVCRDETLEKKVLKFGGSKMLQISYGSSDCRLDAGDGHMGPIFAILTYVQDEIKNENCVSKGN